MIYLDISTIYNRKFRKGLVINNGPLFRYYSFLTRLTVVEVFYPSYPIDDYQKLACVLINDY